MVQNFLSINKYLKWALHWIRANLLYHFHHTELHFLLNLLLTLLWTGHSASLARCHRAKDCRLKSQKLWVPIFPPYKMLKSDTLSQQWEKKLQTLWRMLLTITSPSRWSLELIIEPGDHPWLGWQKSSSQQSKSTIWSERHRDAMTEIGMGASILRSCGNKDGQYASPYRHIPISGTITQAYVGICEAHTVQDNPTSIWAWLRKK